MSRLRFGRARTGHCQVLELAYPELGLIAECPGTTCWPPLDVSKNSTLDFISTICKLLRDFCRACRPANQRSVITQGGIWCRCSPMGMCLLEATSVTRRAGLTTLRLSPGLAPTTSPSLRPWSLWAGKAACSAGVKTIAAFSHFGLMICVADSLTVKAPSFVRGGQDGRYRAQRAGEATQHVVSARVESRVSSTETCHLASRPQSVDRRLECSGVQHDQKRHEPGGDIGRVV